MSDDEKIKDLAFKDCAVLGDDRMGNEFGYTVINQITAVYSNPYPDPPDWLSVHSGSA